ncbi:putative d- protein [Phaeoacremonium minimum UCRPA7]|uniref:Putative d-protein n=1 Tax=Phaeoacremonium minimum (strain UCR-PA7) TaxID=1286976 RepID=R8BVA7_PHAM7|nr:putative d- protein [Phaeoacremonium minimum UCRPA7]EOO03311.1 putative d- protein [Phaeoacremonium minimum UCRPA7]
MSQPIIRDFRADFVYNNFGYDMVGRAIEKLTGKSLGANFKEKLFGPLGMSRTSTQDIPNNTNAAKAYFALDDASPFEVPIPIISDQALMASAGEEGQDIDFEKLATTARETSTTLASKIESTLEEKHEKNTKPLELKAYVGRY